MRLSRISLALSCVQYLALLVPTYCSNLTEELAGIDVPRQPNSRLNSLLNNFCNFLQVKTTSSPRTERTKFMLFKLGTVSTKFYVYAKADVEKKIQEAAETLLGQGFHREYLQKNPGSGFNMTKTAMGFMKKLLAEIKKLVSTDYFVDA